MISALTQIPVLGVPIESKKLKGLDSLLSIAQMPKGIPVGTLAIGEDGAINAALLAAEIMAITNSSIKNSLKNCMFEPVSIRIPIGSHLWCGQMKMMQSLQDGGLHQAWVDQCFPKTSRHSSRRIVRIINGD